MQVMTIQCPTNLGGKSKDLNIGLKAFSSSSDKDEKGEGLQYLGVC